MISSLIFIYSQGDETNINLILLKKCYSILLAILADTLSLDSDDSTDEFKN